MTKEELLIALGGSDKYFHLVDKFFSQNICIPRGVNRHPYADVLHEWIEDSNLTLECWVGGGTWEVSQLERNLYPDTKYRIKPQEPIYEWQWMYKFKNGNEFLFTTYQTEKENEHFMSTLDTTALGESSRKIEETKRERK